MAKVKVLMCDCCGSRMIHSQETKWKDAFKLAKKFGWDIGKKDICKNCKKIKQMGE